METLEKEMIHKANREYKLSITVYYIDNIIIS